MLVLVNFNIKIFIISFFYFISYAYFRSKGIRPVEEKKCNLILPTAVFVDIVAWQTVRIQMVVVRETASVPVVGLVAKLP